MVRDISLTEVASNWWIDISNWEDLMRFFKMLMPYIVTSLNSQLELFENSDLYVDMMDDNGNITFQQDETFHRIEAYNVKKYTDR